MSMRIEDCRAQIDAIDKELIRLLNKRAQIAIEIGGLKRCAALPLCDPRREREILARACHFNAGPLDDRAVVRILSLIIEESKRVETNATQPLDGNEMERRRDQ